MLIVVADDQRNMLEFVQRWFSRRYEADPNMRILTTDDLDSLEVFIARNKQEDEKIIVLLDLNWHQDKQRALKWVHDVKSLESTRHWPILIYSESSQEEDVLGAHQNLANGYVHKGDDDQETHFVNIIEHWKIKQLVPSA